jgi:hypothetical protein
MTGWKTKKEGSIRGKGRKYSLLDDQTGPGDRSALCKMDTGSYIAEDEAAEA